jgi:hypothetical protein
VDEIAGFMAMHGYCGHCRAAAASVKQILAVERKAVAAAVTAAPHHPPGPLRYDPFAAGSPARTAVERLLA